MFLSEDGHATAERLMHEAGLLKEGDRVILTKGDMAGIHGKTNTMKIVEVGSLDSVLKFI